MNGQDVHRLTSYAMTTLLNDVQKRDLAHLLNNKLNFFTVILYNAPNQPIYASFLLLTDALNYMLDKVKQIIDHEREEYSNLYCLEGIEKVFFLSEDDFIFYTLGNGFRWYGVYHDMFVTLHTLN